MLDVPTPSMFTSWGASSVSDLHAGRDKMSTWTNNPSAEDDFGDSGDNDDDDDGPILGRNTMKQRSKTFVTGAMARQPGGGRGSPNENRLPEPAMRGKFMADFAACEAGRRQPQASSFRRQGTLSRACTWM